MRRKVPNITDIAPLTLLAWSAPGCEWETLGCQNCFFRKDYNNPIVYIFDYMKERQRFQVCIESLS